MLKIVKSYEQDPAFADRRDRLLICDNINSHQDAEAVQALRENTGEMFFLPPYLTHLFQPIDVGSVRSIKFHMCSSLDTELEHAAFLTKCPGGKFSASERRILMTKWLGDAHYSLDKSRRM